MGAFLNCPLKGKIFFKTLTLKRSPKAFLSPSSSARLSCSEHRSLMRLPPCRGLCTKHVLAPHLGAHWAKSSSVSFSQCHPAADSPSCLEQQRRHISLRRWHRREAEEDTYHTVGITFKLLSTCQPMTQHLPGRQRAARFWDTVLEDARGWHPATRSLPGVTGTAAPAHPLHPRALTRHMRGIRSR